jgi:SanA protein
VSGLRWLMNSWGKRLVIGLCCCLFVIGPLFALNSWVVKAGDGRIYTRLDEIPVRDVGLVLGTSPRLGSGRVNAHFQTRIEAAAALYHARKVKHLLLSGDNGRRGYDEPTEMRGALLALGVPESATTLDYAGFRTLDSVVRARAVFGQRAVTIISDDFHVQRAIFLGRSSGLDPIAFCAEPVPLAYSRSVRWREYGARIKAVLDIYLLHTSPKYFGPPVEIRIGAEGA